MRSVDDLDGLDLERAHALRVAVLQEREEAPPQPGQHQDRHREHGRGREARPRADQEARLAQHENGAAKGDVLTAEFLATTGTR